MQSASLLFACLVAVLSPSKSFANVVGFDVGTAFFKVGVGKHGEGVNLALNDASKRKTPWVLAFHPDGRRLKGDDAVQLKVRYPESAILYPSRFLGKSYSSQLVEEARAIHPGFHISEDPLRGTCLLGRGVRTADSKHGDGLAPEEAVGTLMRHAVHDIGMNQNERSKLQQVVMTVPSYASQTFRQGALDAARVAGLSSMSLIHDHAAIAIKYGMDRNTFNQTSTLVMFFDQGAGSLKVSIVSFHTTDTKDKRRPTVLQIRVKAVAFDEQVGGYAFDAVVAQMITRTAEKKKAGSTSSVRAKMNILKEAEKARKVLSANKEYQYSLDLGEDFSVKGALLRSDFEEEAKGLFSKILEPVKEALRTAGITANALAAVELVGGACRMPLVQATLAGFLPEKNDAGEKLMRTSMNGDEAAALGATFYAAYLAGYHIRNFNLIDIVPSTIVAQISGSEDDVQSWKVFPMGTALPAVVAASFKGGLKNGDIAVSLYEHGQGSGLGWSVQANRSLDAVQRRGYFKVDRSGIATLDAVEDFTSGAAGQPLVPSMLKLERQSSKSTLTSKMLKTYIDERTNWDKSDAELRKDADARNNLESYIFETKRKVEETLVDVTSEEQRTELLQALDSLEEWLFDAGAEAKAKVYGEKRTEVDRLVAPAVLRATELEARPAAVKKAQDQVRQARQLKEVLLNASKHAAWTGNETLDSEKRKAVGTDSQELGQHVEELEKWLAEKEEAQKALNASTVPAYLSKDVNMKLEELGLKARSTFVRANITLPKKKA